MSLFKVFLLNEVTRTKKYAELSAAEKIQADYDMKATNIILQGHMARQCTKPKRPRNATWGSEVKLFRKIFQTMVFFQIEDLDTYDSDVMISRVKKACFHGQLFQLWLLTFISGVMYAKHVATPVIDDEETLIIEEESQSKILSDDFGKRLTPQQELSAEQAFWLRMSITVFKEQFDSIKKTRVRTKEHSDSLIDKLNLKSAENKDLKAQIQDKEQVDILQRIVEQVKSKQPLDKELDFAYVKHSLLNANSEPICATCMKSMFDGVHDMGLLDFVENVNSRAKFAKKHIKQNIWKPTGHVFTEVGLKWKPTGRTFTIVGNSCPLTRITLANVVPPKKTTSDSVETQKPELKVYSWKPKNVNNVASSKNLSYPDCSLVSGLWMFEPYDREPLLAYELSGECDYLKKGVDLLFGSRDTNLYTISLDDMLKTSMIGLISKASKTKSWLWHHKKDHLDVFACDLGKSKKSSHQPKAKDTNQEKFLRTKDEAPEAIIKCIKNIQVRLNATVRNVRTDNGTEFVNQTLHEFYENVGISHQTSVARTPQQNDIVKKVKWNSSCSYNVNIF
ncbi:retrovirus-related pol polyprotein from transposon TNT 1-94 [Tanacetum coccineum]